MEPITNWHQAFNNWRKNYVSMSYQEHLAFYTEIAKTFPNQHHHILINYLQIFDRLSYLYSVRLQNFRPRVRVLEVGGWDGELAGAILQRHPTFIDNWTNIEIAIVPPHKSVLGDSRYQLIIPDDFLWNKQYKDLSMGYDVFLMAHCLEHITYANFVQLYKRFIQYAKIVLIESPLPDKTADINWTDYAGTHIFEKGWEDIEQFFHTHKHPYSKQYGTVHVFYQEQQLLGE